MRTESLRRTSEVIENPSQSDDVDNVVKLDVLKQKSDSTEFQAKVTKVAKRVNIEVLKQRLYEEKKKQKVKRTIILSSVIVSLGALTMLTY